MGDQIVGTVLCGHEGRRGILRHLVVKKEFRRKGIARALTKECLLALEKEGIKKCNTFVEDTNLEGRRFWEHMGWSVLEDSYRTMQIRTPVR
jgi:putative acetyltransferase